MSTLAARQPSYSAPQTSPAHQSRSASVTREDDVEPSEEWKRQLRQRIEEGLQDMVHDAKSNLEAKTRQVQGPASASYREHLNAEYVAALSEIRKLAAEQFQAELERERQERRWAVGIALTPGWDEALKQEQQSILDTIQKAGKSDDFIDLSPQSTRPPYSATRAPPTDPISRRDGSMHPPYPGSPSIPDSVSRRDGQTYARTADAYRSPAPPDSASRREGFGSGVSRSQDYAGLSRDRDTLSIRSSDSGYATGTTFVDEPEETLPLRPKRRSDASSHIERPSEDPERPPEPSGRPFDRSSARSVSERHATSPPRIPELWKPSISPEEDIASSRPYQMARRGSTASMKSNNSGSASYRSPSTSAIPERIREHVEAEGSGERERDRDRDRDRERSRTQEIQMSPSPWAYDKPRERHDSTSFRTDNRQGSLNTQQRRPQTVEELEYQSMQHTSYTSWFSDPNAKVIPPPSARLDSADYSPRVTDLRYQTHRSIPRPHIPDEFDFRLPPELPETRPQRTPSLSLDNPSYFGDHETDARLITAATGRRPSLSRRTDDKLPPQSALSAKVAREQSLTMDLAKQQQPLSSPSIGGPKFSPIADEPRYSVSNGTRELLDDTGSLRRSEGLNGHVTRSSSVSYGTQGSSRVASTSPNVYSYSAASPTPPMPMPGRSAKYDYQRSSPGSKEWNDSPRSVDTGSFTQYSAAIETRRPLSSRPSLQTFRPELPVVAPEEDLGDDMDLEPIPESTYQRSRHRSSDADLRPYRSQAGADRYRENKRMEEQVRKEEEEKRQRIETARIEEERKKAADEARRNEEMRERFRKREELAAKRREEEAKRRREEEARRQMEEARAEARRREEEEEAERKRVMEEEEARRKQEEEETRRREEEEEEARRREEEEARRREEEEEEDRRREEEEEARRRQEEEEARLKEEEEMRHREEAEKAEARRRELAKQEAQKQAAAKQQAAKARRDAKAAAAKAKEEERRKREEEQRRKREDEERRKREEEDEKRRNREAELARQEAIRRKEEEARMVAEAIAAREEDNRRRVAEEAEGKRRQEAEEEERRAQIKRAAGELAARQAEVERREEEEARQRELAQAEVLRAKEETKKKEQEVRRKEEEARRKEEEVKRKEEEAKKKEEEIRLKEEEARRKVEEMQKKEEETKRKEEEIRRREEDLKRREDEFKRREEEARKKEEEKQRAEDERDRFKREEERLRAQQQEEYRKREEDIKRRTEERKRQDSESSGSYPGTSPTASSSWTSTQRTTTASHMPSSSPTDRTATSTPSRPAASWSTWGAAAANNSYTNGRPTPAPAAPSTPKPTPSNPRSASTSIPSAATSPSTPLSQAEWARRQAEQAQKQQEAFRKEQERFEMERQARQGRMLTKDEVLRIFQTHEMQWSKLPTLEQLNWDSFPWPMIKKPATAEDITTAAVSAYVLSPHYPDKTKSDKDRIKEYIRRWHPDRFETKYLTRVTEEDKERVKEGAGTVVRNLNELLTRTNAPSLFQ